MGTLIPLRRFHVSRHRPHLDIGDRWLDVHHPADFGPRPWRIDTTGVAVVDRCRSRAGERPVLEEVPVLPYLATTTPWVPANVTLLFDPPRRLPELRLGVGRSLQLLDPAGPGSGGAPVDGIRLRTPVPAAAIDALVAADVEPTADVDGWLGARRREVTGTGRHADVVRQRTRRRWVANAGYAGFALALLTVRFVRGDDVPAAVVVAHWALVLVSATAVLFDTVSARRNRRSWR